MRDFLVLARTNETASKLEFRFVECRLGAKTPALLCSPKSAMRQKQTSRFHPKGDMQINVQGQLYYAQA
ncbi:hypothetical protein [Brevundimonas sp.]|uniref:hypothetical protein n=1 Tax=Brevundimonas sp. TaxID=1871086 RepID=UPI003AFFFACD